jgi:HAD domain in Swiss Army Knife RNA repair proteins
MALIFLDVDGVLNTHEDVCPHVACGQIHADKVQRLKQVILKHRAKIVLSSSWRYLVHRGEMDLKGLNWLFRSHGFPADCIVDVTRPDTISSFSFQANMGFVGFRKGMSWPVENERGRQIKDWLAGHEHGAHVVIDDLDLGISEAGLPFVKTHPREGLTDAKAAEMDDVLESYFNR